MSGPGRTGGQSARGADTIEEEVRLSLVLYGGVSLAIYINGVCLELLNMVKATSDAALESGSLDMATSSRVYRAAAALTPSLLADPGPDGEELFADLGRIGRDDTLVRNLGERPMRRRFVVDVLSGSSAGGLNAAYLAKALVLDQSLDPLKELWVNQGDINRLLNDDQVDDALPEPLRGRVEAALEPAEIPTSLLSGDRFYVLLRGAFEAMAGDEAGEDTEHSRRPLVEALDCYLTATDLRGIPVTIELADGRPAAERRHRVVGHLVYGSRDATGGNRNDFRSKIDSFLAFLCRATAAHPAAFHPAQLEQIATLVNAVPSWDDGGFRHDDPAWGAYVQPRPAEGIGERWYSDGGDMDNKPFTYALEPIRTRLAEVPVDRKVVYVEPSPGRISDEPDETGLPTLGGYTVQAALLGRTENIRDDIEVIKARNRQVADLRRSMADVLGKPVSSEPWDEEEHGDDPNLDALRRARRSSANSWVTRWDSEAVAQRVYEMRRARAVISEQVDLVLSLARFPSDTPHAGRVRRAVRTYLEAEYELLGGTDPAEPWANHRKLLVDFDIGYRLRRLAFIDQVLSAAQRYLNSSAPVRSQLWVGREVVPDETPVAEVRQLRRQLNRQFVLLRAFARAIRHAGADGDTVLADWPQPGAESGQRIRREMEPFVRQLQAAAAAAAERADDEEFDILAGVELAGFFALLRRLSDEMLTDNSVRSRLAISAVEPEEFRQQLQGLWNSFDEFDIHLLSSWEDTQGEVDEAEIVRVSPVDATAIIDVHDDAHAHKHKLAGDAIHHFGGFFDPRWRQADLLWGRLDAAEMLIRTLVPLDALPMDPERSAKVERLRAELIKRAHLDILGEERAITDVLEEISTPSTDPNHPTGTKNVSPEEVYRYLETVFDADLSIRSDSTRTETKNDFLQRAPEVIGKMLGRGDIDPYAGGRHDHGSRTYRVYGKVVDAIVQLGTLKTTFTKYVKVFLVLLATAGAVGFALPMFAPLWNDSGIRALLVGLAATVGGAGGLFLLGRRSRHWQALGVALLVGWAGVLIWLTTPFFDQAGVAAVLAFNAVLSLVGAIFVTFSGRFERSSFVSRLNVVLFVAALVWVILAGWVDWALALLVAASFVIALVVGVLVVLLDKLQGWLVDLGEPKEEEPIASRAAPS